MGERERKRERMRGREGEEKEIVQRRKLEWVRGKEKGIR